MVPLGLFSGTKKNKIGWVCVYINIDCISRDKFHANSTSSGYMLHQVSPLAISLQMVLNWDKRWNPNDVE